MAEVIASGIRFHVQRLPAHRPTGSTNHPAHAPTVVFVHGLGVDMSSFYYTLANPAARAGADVVLYDLRGHGETERPPSGYSVEESVRDLTELLDELGVSEPVHLVGNSYGGMVALALAMTHPARVASLLLIEALVEFTAMSQEEWKERLTSMLAEGIRVRRALSGRRTRYESKVQRFYSTYHAMVNGTTLTADLRAQRPFHNSDLRSVTCPVAAVYGEKSDIIRQGFRLKHVLPNCDLTVVPKCGHFLIAEASDVLRDLLLRWLKSNTPNPNAQNPNAQTHLMPTENALAR